MPGNSRGTARVRRCDRRHGENGAGSGVPGTAAPGRRRPPPAALRARPGARRTVLRGTSRHSVTVWPHRVCGGARPAAAGRRRLTPPPGLRPSRRPTPPSSVLSGRTGAVPEGDVMPLIPPAMNGIVAVATDVLRHVPGGPRLVTSAFVSLLADASPPRPRPDHYVGLPHRLDQPHRPVVHRPSPAAFTRFTYGPERRRRRAPSSADSGNGTAPIAPLPGGSGLIRRSPPNGGPGHVRVKGEGSTSRHRPQQDSGPAQARSSSTVAGRTGRSRRRRPSGDVMQQWRGGPCPSRSVRPSTTWCRRRSSPRSSTARP
jgi:hypothetical protein